LYRYASASRPWGSRYWARARTTGGASRRCSLSATTTLTFARTVGLVFVWCVCNCVSPQACLVLRPCGGDAWIEAYITPAHLHRCMRTTRHPAAPPRRPPPALLPPSRLRWHSVASAEKTCAARLFQSKPNQIKTLHTTPRRANTTAWHVHADGGVERLRGLPGRRRPRAAVHAPAPCVRRLGGGCIDIG
jgi:hypothetical protein